MKISELFLPLKAHILLYFLVNNNKIKYLPPRLKKKKREETWKTCALLRKDHGNAFLTNP